MGKGKKKSGKKNANYKPIKDDSDTDHTSRRRSARKKKINGVAMATDDYQLRQHIEGDGSRTIIDIAADGNCLFGSLSDQLYYDDGRNHAEIRHQVCNFMEEHKDDFVVFLVLDDEDATDDEEDAPDFDSYIDSMRRPCEWGGHLELVAAARLYRYVCVYSACVIVLILSASLTLLNLTYINILWEPPDATFECFP